MATEYKRMQQRNDTAANWSSINPVLAAAEIGYDTTNKKFKIGDGSTTWNNLPYFSGGSSYNEGNGIDIQGGNISVDANTSQFTFNNGKLTIQTAGNNGFPTNQVMNQTINTVLGGVITQLQTI